MVYLQTVLDVLDESLYLLVGSCVVP